MNLFSLLLKPSQKPYLRTTRKVQMLGRALNFQIQQGKRNSACLINETISVTLHSPTKQNFDVFVEAWYKRQAHKLYKATVEKYMPEFERLEYDIPKPSLKIYKMTRAWGRCYYTKGTITINSKLMRLPMECVEYIILHEMTHFVAHDHGMLFRAVLDKIDPEWRSKEAMLRRLEQDKSIMR